MTDYIRSLFVSYNFAEKKQKKKKMSETRKDLQSLEVHKLLIKVLEYTNFTS